MLPDSVSKKIDYWGYYNNNTAATTLAPSLKINPSNTGYQRYLINTDSASRTDYTYTLAGNVRAANPGVVATGTLNMITYNDNASTVLEYESNDYYDPSAGAVIKGGGIRVTKITDFDGIDINKNTVKTYTYLNPSTGVSSGKPVTLPQYAFTRPYTGSGTTAQVWNYSTIRSEEDLSDEDHTVMYAFVKESMAGAGSTLYEYSVPATNWDTSASPDWAPTIDYAGTTGCASYGLIKNYISSYPFAPNTNFDFERGLLKKLTGYRANGDKISEKSFTYQRTSTSKVVITGLRTLDNSFAKGYAKYNIYGTLSNLVVQQDEKIYDSQTAATSQASSTTYTYDSPNHKLVTAQQTTNSNGVAQTVHYKYVKDFTATAPSVDPTINALYFMQQQNINMPIETYVQTGSKVTGGNIVKPAGYAFSVAGAGTKTLYLPAQRLQLFSADGLSSFTPSGITSGAFNNDTHYIIAENDRLYDNLGFLQTRDDNRKHVSTVLTDSVSQLPVAMVANAAADEIGFNNFGSPAYRSAFGLTSGSYTYSNDSRGGNRSLAFTAGQVLNRTVKKNAIAKSYIFSCWVKAGIAGYITLTLTPTSGSAVTDTLRFGSGSVWKYIHKAIDISSISAGTFTATFLSSQNILLDDVWFYPGVAEVSSTDYNDKIGKKIAETNTNGVSVYYTYDGIGRLSLVYDQDNNIVQRKQYGTPTPYYSGLPTPSFTFSPTLQTNDTYNPVTFKASSYFAPSQFPGATYTWNFGDAHTATGESVTHTYASVGTYTVTLTLSAPGYTSVTSTQQISVVEPPVYITTSNDATDVSFVFITLSQGGVVKYDFRNDTGFGQIPVGFGVPIKAGTYDIEVQVNGSFYDPGSDTGYKNLQMRVDTGNVCRANFGTHPGRYTYTGVDLATAKRILFLVSTADCP